MKQIFNIARSGVTKNLLEELLFDFYTNWMKSFFYFVLSLLNAFLVKSSTPCEV